MIRNSRKQIAFATVLISFLFQTAAFAASNNVAQRLKQHFPLAASALQIDREVVSRAHTSAFRENDGDVAGSLAIAGGRARLTLHADNAARGVVTDRIGGREVAILENDRASLGYDVRADGFTAAASDRGVAFLGQRGSLGISAPLVIDAVGRPTSAAHWDVERTSVGVTGIRLKVDDARAKYPLAVIYSTGTAAGVRRDSAALIASLATRHTPSTEAGSGVITGTVRGADTGQGLPDLFIEIYDSLGNFAGFGVTDSNGFYRSQAGGEDGGGLATGNYFVVAFANGYVRQVYNNINCPSDTCDPTSGTPVSVTNAETTSNINFNLPLAVARIAGTVTNSSTLAALPDVAVGVYDASNNLAAVGFSDASGVWDVLLPGAGTFYAKTQNSQYAGFVDQLWNSIACTGCTATSGTAINATLGTTQGGINLKLTPNGGRIRGQILSGVTPISGHVSVYNSSGVLVSTGDVDSGTMSYISFNGLAAGNYYAVATSSGYHSELYSGFSCNGCNPTTGTAINVPSGQQVTANFHLTRAFALVTGRVTAGAGGPALGGVSVVFYDSLGNRVTDGTADFNDGSYSVELPVNGSYFARAENTTYGGFADQLYNGMDCSRCDVTRGTAINVTDGTPISGINFPLNSNAASIAGRVMDARNGSPLAFALVLIYASNGENASFAFTDGSGDYISFNGLSQGAYYAVASASGFNGELYSEIACSNCDPTTGTAINVTAGQAKTNVNFTLARQVATITGRVFDASTTAALGGVTVKVYDSTGTEVAATQSLGGNDGNYFVDLAAGGTYYARTFVPNTLTYADQLYDHISCASGCTITNGTAINASVGDVVSNVDFALTSPACSGRSIQPTTVPDSNVGGSYSQQLTVTGGSGASTFVIADGALPDGLTLSSGGLISGTTTAGGSFAFTVKATDTAGCSTARNYEINVENPATTTTLTVSATTATFGTSITLTATVSPSTATGTVSFFDDTTLVGTATLSSGTATLVLTPAAGEYDYFARYEGNATLAPSSSNTIHVTITKATPIITWNNPADIVYPTALSSTQLNATANVPGSFTYTPAAGTFPNAGTQTLSVLFVPTDSANYNNATKNVSIVVNKAAPSISVIGGTFTFDGNPHPATGTATGVFGEDLGPLTFTYNGSSNPPVSVGTYTVVGTYPGSDNYLSDSATVTITIVTGPASTSAISKNFTGQAIAGGTTIWFNAAFDTLSGVGTTANVAVFITGQHITFTASGTNYDLVVPDGKIVFNDSSVTQPTTSYDAVNNLMVTRFPNAPSLGNSSAFLSGLGYTVPAGGLPGGIKSVTWTGTFSTNSPTNVALHWKWAASVFSVFSSDYNNLAIKSVDGQTTQFPNNDKAGTPENFKQFVSGNGATGGSYSGNANVTVPHQ